MEWPKGHITFLFTDMKNSTGIALAVGDERYRTGLYDPQEKAFLEIVSATSGKVFQHTGDGYVAVFQKIDDALQAAIRFQETVRVIPALESGQRVEVRIGLHTSTEHIEPITDENDMPRSYGYGQISLASRVMNIAWEEQILLSPSAWENLTKKPDEKVVWEGRFLKSLDEGWDITEICYDGVRRREPGTRFAPTWYVGEKNRYVSRKALEDSLIERFKQKIAENACLVVLQGEGGMGKTRLGVQVATRVCGLYKDKVFFVPLAHAGRGPELSRSLSENVEAIPTNLTDEQLLDALVRELGKALELDEKLWTEDAVRDALLLRESLLVLDNFESVACEKVREWLGEVVGSARSLFLLLTTREAHGIVGLGSTLKLTDGMADSEARELFESRARAVHGETNAGEIWKPDVPSVDTIIKVTDGVPLLIEYAAAWAVYGDQKTTAASLKAALDGPTPTIAREMGVPDGQAFHDDKITERRHHQFACTLNWSYNLLGQHYGPDAQRCFLACGLFESEFDANVAAEVYGKGFRRELLNALPLCSLLTRREENGTAWYAMHRRTRAYALAILKTQVEETAILQNQYASCFTRMAIIEGRNVGVGKIEVIGNAIIRLSQYASDIETVLLIHAGNQNTQAAQMVSALSNYIGVSSRRIRKDVLVQVALASQRGGDELGYANNLFTQGFRAFQIGDNAEASLKYLEALPIFRRAQDPLGEANCIKSLGDIALRVGDNAEASSKYLEALPIYRRAQEPVGEANCIQSLGFVQIRSGERTSGMQEIQNAMAIYERIGNTYLQGGTWYQLMQYAESAAEREEYREKARKIWADSGQVELIEMYLS